MCVCLYLCVGSLRGQKRASDPLELELQEVGAGNSAQVLWKSSKCFLTAETALGNTGWLAEILLSLPPSTGIMGTCFRGAGGWVSAV